MYEFFSGNEIKQDNSKPTILITGANGWIGRNTQHALYQKYNLILLDINNANNRFSLEEVNEDHLPTLKLMDYKIDLAEEKDRFAEIITKINPDCVIHLAGALENQDIEIINKNHLINQNVLSVCAEKAIKVISASSIMVMYGAALSNQRINSIFNKQSIELESNEKLTVDTPLNNTEETIKRFDEAKWEKNLAYIKCKEELEHTAKLLTEQNANLTFITVRFGWSGIKNPYEYENEQNATLTETPIYIHQNDLQDFVLKLTDAVVEKNASLSGYKCYICVSNHPASWVEISNAKEDFNWSPTRNIKQEFQEKISHEQSFEPVSFLRKHLCKS